jgi:hypothetical protein
MLPDAKMALPRHSPATVAASPAMLTAVRTDSTVAPVRWVSSRPEVDVSDIARRMRSVSSQIEALDAE